MVHIQIHNKRLDPGKKPRPETWRYIGHFVQATNEDDSLKMRNFERWLFIAQQGWQNVSVISDRKSDTVMFKKPERERYCNYYTS